MTSLEAKKHLCRKLNIDYDDVVAGSNDLWSEADLDALIEFGILKAWDLHPWPFTQKAKTATTNNTGYTNGYYDFPNDLMAGSVFLVKVGGKEYKHIDFQDYHKLFEDIPTATDRVWSEWENYIFINKNSYTVGDIYDLFGKKFPVMPVSDTDLLPFSPVSDDKEHSGNEAIVQLAYAEALDSDKKKEYAQAETERKKAYQTLDILWQPFADQKALSQSKGRPMFDVPDFFGQGKKKDPTFNGNFHYL